MVRIRAFEELAADCFMKGMLAGNIHLSIGQEAVAAGACAAMDKEDYMTTTHRGHGHCIAKGGNIDKMFAELFGKKTGYCKGKGGSMHIADVEGLHHLGANGIVGAGIPIATGSALASKIWKDKHVTVCFFGDGASNQGVFHESLNMAAAWHLPVVYVIESNRYAVSTEIHRVTNTEFLSVRAKAYNMPGKTVDGNDPTIVYEAMKEALDYARSGKGPYLLECETYRHQGHYCGDPAAYRPASYMEEAHKDDCIPCMRAKLLKGKTATEKDLKAIEDEAKAEMEKGLKFAEDSEWPDPSEATTEMYSSDNERSVVR
ncbi:MAG: thiamine pyrophosphate-dependent dehydrogenase E1 component subunit alpha [Acidaminococcaceae bacterium]|jgi:pyruvate dehydrogenase E1 component alpha subunit|nr:thiamine pyrophosphate-dependent dehydrogenase E1 component subunit alpha [Acidaminococcaceae bacterium]MCI2109597.1 thiamine pyrophosphate-dependent dehydrogenase E1 component subunit alpha [Acidaminococcaceae bacterium]